MKYLIYTRISPRGSDFDRTAENSTVMQEEYCRNFIASIGGTITDVYRDEFFSGKDLNRPKMREIIQQLENGNAEWDCLAVYNLARMTRSPRDMYQIFEKLARTGKRFLSIKEPDFDFSKPTSEMIMGIISHVNQFMRKSSAAIVRDKMMAIARRGLWPAGWAPFGYKRGAAKDNHLYVDPVKSAVVQQIFQMYASDNNTTRVIVHKFRGIVSHSKIMTILRDPVYLGKINYAGEIFPGQHDPIISPELFQAVQDKLPQKKNHTRPKAQSYPFLLTGILKCECGCRLTPGTAKSGQYAYYTCTDISCKKRISAPKIEKEIINHISEIEISQRIIDATVAELLARNHEQSQIRRPELNEYLESKKELLHEKNKITDVLISSRLTPSLIDSLNEKMEIIETKLQALQAKIEAIQSLDAENDELYIRASLVFVNQVKKLKDAIDGAPAEKLRAIIPLFLREITLKKDGTCDISLREPLKSSTNYPKWCAVVEFLEPVFFTLKVA